MKEYQDLPFMSTNKEQYKKDLIDFRRPNLWMSSIEHNKKVSNGGELAALALLGVVIACYFIFR